MAADALRVALEAAVCCCGSLMAADAPRVALEAAVCCCGPDTLGPDPTDAGIETARVGEEV